MTRREAISQFTKSRWIETALARRGGAVSLAALLALGFAVLAPRIARADDLVQYEKVSRDAIKQIGEMAPDLIRRVELRWEAQDEARYYELQLSLKPDFSDTLYSEKLEDTRFSVDLLPGTYYYRVRSVDEHGRPGRWTETQQLNINARPPVLMWPQDGKVFEGPLPDTGIELQWRTSGPGIHYIVEVNAQDEDGSFSKTVVKQEVTATTFPFFPQTLGKFQWSVHTLGAGGEEPGAPWSFTVLGDIPRGQAKAAPGAQPVRVIRFVPPWWRGHWTLYAGYGQASLGYSIVDHDFRSSSQFTGFTGYMVYTLNWEWHDPVSWLMNGIPAFEGEWELDRQTVLSESVVLPRYSLRSMVWFDEWVRKWRFSPLSLEAGRQDIGIYQPQSPVEALRSNATRYHFGIGPSAEWTLRPFLVFSASAEMNFEFGGLSGIYPVGGVNDLANRAGNLENTTGFTGVAGATIILNPRLKLRGRVRYQSSPEAWVGRFPSQPGTPFQSPDTTVKLNTMSFDVGLGFKF